MVSWEKIFDFIVASGAVQIGIVFALLKWGGKVILDPFFSEKAKNLATKTDLKEITTTVESVKADFATKIEKLKTDLQFDNIVKSSTFNDRKKVIIDINISIELIEQKLRNAVDKGHHATVEFYDKAVEELEAKRKNLLIKRTKFKLYITDITKVNQLFAIVDGIIELEYIVNDSFEELCVYAERINAAENDYYALFANPTQPININNPPASLSEAKDLCNKIVTYNEGERQAAYSELTRKFHTARNLISPLINEFQRYCSDVILHQEPL